MTTPEQEWLPVTREVAVEAGWTTGDIQGTGTVTRAFDEWLIVDQDLRTFLQVTLKWMGERYTIEWESAMSEPVSDDMTDPPDLFSRRVGGLWPDEHEWMTLAAVLRDAVTVYEVYLAKAYAEVLLRHGQRWKNPERTPSWPALQRAYRLLGLDPKPSAIDEIVRLRDILTHRRGELRTDEDRRRYADRAESFGDRVAHLSDERVLGYLDALGANVQAVEPVLWAYSWGPYRAPELQRRGGG